jgi:hypothetical protein
MLKFFKIRIPKDNVTEVTIQQSWILEWTSYKHSSGRYADSTFNAKVFTKHEDALEYEKQLKECARFINTSISTNLKEN